MSRIDLASSESVAIADWLVDRTALTLQQIADFCGLPLLQVQSIANGTMPSMPPQRNPIRARLLSEKEVARCSRDVDAVLEKPIERLLPEPALVPWDGGHIDRDGPIHSLGTVALYYIHYGRNAWHSTWIGRYYRRGSLWGTLAGAKQFVERERVQGSVFTIEEIPALSFRADRATLVISPLNAPERLRDIPHLGDEPLLLSRVAADFTRESATYVTLVTEGNVACKRLRSGTELRRWHSFPQGTGYRLGWRTLPGRHFEDRTLYRRIKQTLDRSALAAMKLAMVQELFPGEAKHLSDIDFFCEPIGERHLRLTARCCGNERSLLLTVSELGMALKYLGMVF